MLLLACLGCTACTATHEGSLGWDLPRVRAEPDAEPVVDVEANDAAVLVEDASDAPVAPARPVVVEAGQVRDRDASALADAQSDAAPAACTPYGHHPFDGLPTPTPLPKPDEWDGGLPPRFGDPLSPSSGLSPREFEAGVPPFCCTLMTPWFCAPPSSSGSALP